MGSSDDPDGRGIVSRMSGGSRRLASVLWASTAAGGLVVPACTTSGGSDQRPAVFAASSLSALLDDVEGPEFVASLAGSQTLRAQIEGGARPDVFVSASRLHADSVAGIEGYVDSVPVFCAPLVAVVRADSQLGISAFQDFWRVERFAIAAEEVPAGMWAARMLGLYDSGAAQHGLAEHVRARAISLDLSVLQVAQRVLRREADVGFVYAPVAAMFDEELVVIRPPARAAVTASYWATGTNAAELMDWLEALRASAFGVGVGFQLCAFEAEESIADSTAQPAVAIEPRESR